MIRDVVFLLAHIAGKPRASGDDPHADQGLLALLE